MEVRQKSSGSFQLQVVILVTQQSRPGQEAMGFHGIVSLVVLQGSACHMAWHLQVAQNLSAGMGAWSMP